MCAANSNYRNCRCALCCFRFAGFIMGMTSACSCALTLTAPYVTAALLVTVSLLFSPCRHVTICLLSCLIAVADKGDPPQPVATPQVSVFMWLNYHSSRSSTNERQSSSHRRSHSSTHELQSSSHRRSHSSTHEPQSSSLRRSARQMDLCQQPRAWSSKPVSSC